MLLIFYILILIDCIIRLNIFIKVEYIILILLLDLKRISIKLGIKPV